VSKEEEIPKLIGLAIDYRKCNGCRICEIACSVKHFGEHNPELSRIRVWPFWGLIEVPATCWGCKYDTDPPCVLACPTAPKAITWDDTLGVPRVNEEECIGCVLCTDACKAKAIHLNPRTNKALVCDRCGGDPECVKQCPVEAIQAFPTTIMLAKWYANNSPEDVAEDMKKFMFYPWKGLEDWKENEGEE
jgi:Fe-S-cluster-containing hydrogenase component 2